MILQTNALIVSKGVILVLINKAVMSVALPNIHLMLIINVKTSAHKTILNSIPTPIDVNFNAQVDNNMILPLILVQIYVQLLNTMILLHRHVRIAIQNVSLVLILWDVQLVSQISTYYYQMALVLINVFWMIKFGIQISNNVFTRIIQCNSQSNKILQQFSDVEVPSLLLISLVGFLLTWCFLLTGIYKYPIHLALTI